MTDKYPVVIVGAGPAGSSTAYFLSKSGIKTLLLDKSDFPRDKLCGGAISPASLSILEEMNLSKNIESYQRITGVKFISPTGESVVGNVPKIGQFRDFGYVIPRISLDYMLRTHAISSGAKFDRKEVMDVDYNKRELTTRNGNKISSDFIILADGAVSRLSKKYSSRDISMPALEARFEGVEMDDKLFIYFHKDILPGYFWIFPEGNGKANVGLGMSNPLRKVNLVQIYNGIVNHDKRVREILHGAKEISSPKRWIIGSRSKPYNSREGVISIGDSGGFANQFTGEGIYYALKSGKLVAQCIATGAEPAKEFEQTSKEFNEDIKLSYMLRQFFQEPKNIGYVLKKARESQEFNSLLQGIVTNVLPKKEIQKFLI